jgi:hypothetical protein
MSVRGNQLREPELHPLYAARLWRMGKSLVFPLYEAVITALGAKPGDLVLVRVHLPYVTFRIAHPDLTMPIPRFTPGELPPSYAELLKDIAERLR